MLSKSKSDVVNNIQEFITIKRKPFIGVGIALAVLLSIFIAFRFWTDEKNPVYQLLSSSAVVLVETDDLAEVLADCRAASSLYSFVPFLEFVTNRFNEPTVLDSLIKLSGHQKAYISLNAAGKNDVDLVFYLKCDEGQTYAYFENLVREDDAFLLDRRLFDDRMIYDFGKRGDRNKFSFLFYNGFFIGSFSGFLLEDVARNLETEKDLTWTEAFRSAKDTSITRICINHKNLPGYLALYCTPNYVTDSKRLATFAASSDFKWEKGEEGITLLGKTIASEKQYLTTFKTQSPVKFSMEAAIPDNASAIFRLGISDPVAWFSEFSEQNKTFVPADTANGEVKKVIQLMKDEVAWVIAEPEMSNRVFQYAIIKTSDANELMKTFRALADSSTSVATNNPNRKIYALHKKNLLEQLFGPVFSGFKEYFLTSHGSFIVIGNQLTALEAYLQQVQNGFIFKKTEGVKFFEEPSNVAFYVNPSRSEFLLNKHVRDTRIKNNWLNPSASVAYAGVYFSSEPDQTYSFKYVVRKGKGITTGKAKSLAAGKTLQFNAGLISEAYPVKAISGLEEHFLVQDSSSKIHLFSRFGTILWSTQVDGKISSVPVSGNIDKTGKDEIVFAVKNKVYAINGANGVVVKGYPVTVPGKPYITSLALIDYDGSRNYRIFAGDDSGNLYAMDVQGKLLDGWAPKKIDYSIIGQPAHVRIADKDYIIALSRKGKLHVFNRKGQYIKGFPVKLEHASSSSFFIEKSSAATNSYLSILSERGELIKVDFTGTVAKRLQLFRLSPESRFALYPDDRMKSYTIVRKDKNRLDFLDMSLSPLFTQTNFSLDKYDIRYIHSIAANVSYWLLNDLSNHRSIVFTPKGKFIGEGWIKSQEKATAVYLEKYNEGVLVKVNKKSIDIARIK